MKTIILDKFQSQFNINENSCIDRMNQRFWGKYRGITFEICLNDGDFQNIYKDRISSLEPYHWTSYIHLDEKNQLASCLTKEELDALIDESYKGGGFYNNDKLWFWYNLPFHGGITYSAYKSYMAPQWSGCYIENGTITIGCDYQHLDDRTEDYPLYVVEGQIKEIIDLIHERFLNMKIRCQGNGKWYLESEGNYKNNSKNCFISNEYTKTKD